MLRRSVSILGVAAGIALCLAMPALAAPPSTYVIAASADLPANLSTLVSAAGGTLQRTQPEIGIAQATSTNPRFAATLGANSAIQSVTLDTLVQWTPSRANLKATISLAHPLAPSHTTPALDPQAAAFYACQWNLDQIDAPGAWAQGAFGSPGSKVAVLDTGIDAAHIDLAGKVDTAASVSVLTAGSSPCGSADETSTFDYDFHGTFVSSQIAGNLIGMASVAPATQIVMVKVLNCQGSGSFGDLITGLHYAAQRNDVEVINLSLGALIPRAGNLALIAAIDRAVLYARLRGKLVVVAAGNDGVQLTLAGPNVDVPAQSLGAISIYATTIDQQLASYSNFGRLTWVGAPGGDQPNPEAPRPGCPLTASLQSLVLGACTSALCGTESSYVAGDGTSFASPLVAGVAALVDAAGHDADVTAGHIKRVLRRTADPIGPPDLFSNGRVNAAKAVTSQRNNSDPGSDN